MAPTGISARDRMPVLHSLSAHVTPTCKRTPRNSANPTHNCIAVNPLDQTCPNCNPPMANVLKHLGPATRHVLGPSRHSFSETLGNLPTVVAHNPKWEDKYRLMVLLKLVLAPSPKPPSWASPEIILCTSPWCFLGRQWVLRCSGCPWKYPL